MASLFVYMNGYEVGEYIRHRSGAQEFIYSDSWLDKKSAAIPLSLSMPLTSKNHKGEAVYNYFENLLPDSLDIKNRIQARFAAKTNQAFDLLTHIGRDCIGAIQLLPERSNESVKNIQGKTLSENEIANSLKNYHSQPLGMSEDNDFRISLAGAQEKTAFLWFNDQWQRPIGHTPSTHIFKLPIGRIEHAGIDLSTSVENEWLCLQILEAFNVPVANSKIEVFDGQKVLVVKRFDRQLSDDKSWIVRLPQEDMCQVLAYASARKYESDKGPGIEAIMNKLMASSYPEKDRQQFIKSNLLFWMLGAIDGHAKNFSIFLNPGGRFHLTPLYDVISAYPLVQQRQLEQKKLKLAMAIHGKNSHYRIEEIQVRHWFDQAVKVRFPKPELKKIMFDIVDTFEPNIASVSKNIPNDFPDEIVSPIIESMRKMNNKLKLALSDS